jgi:phosphotransferase system  glucose/maltose/N-acetylglucosamine-specific IIC component
MMMSVLKGTGIGGSIIVILALVIYLLKTLIAFIAFLTGAVKIMIILAFVALIVGVGLMVLKGLRDRRSPRD